MENSQAALKTEQQDPLVPVRVIILYENLETGHHARRTYDYLVESLDGICQFTVQLWKFNLLDDDHLRGLAAQDALQAEIVIVSSLGEFALPDGVKRWFEQWPGTTDHPIALVGLFSHPEQAAPVRDYLEKIAKAKGVEFFAEPGSSSNVFKPSPFLFLTPDI